MQYLYIKEIGKFYEDDADLFIDDEEGSLVDIGEISAIAFGYLH